MDDVFTCFCSLVCTICLASIDALQFEQMQVGANVSWGCLVEQVRVGNLEIGKGEK